MGLYVLEVMLWILDIRGHIPQFDDYRRFPAEPSPAAGAGPLVRTLTVLAVTLAVVALAIWAAVWLAIRLL
jgi:hypothetical protein